MDPKSQIRKKLYRGGGSVSGKTPEELRDVVMKDAVPFGSECSARVEDDDDSQCRWCAMRTGHGERSANKVGLTRTGKHNTINS
jgi:hypothetical protein